jgi:hypothetical protein
MSVPIAFWTASRTAVVLFLSFSLRPDDGGFSPVARMMGYSRNGGPWIAGRWAAGVGWSYDPVAHPDAARDLGGRAMVHGGGSYSEHPAPGRPAAIMVGRVGPAVTQLELVQDGTADRRPLRSHFGAWVVGVERWSPYEVNALDRDGTVLASVSGPPRLPAVPGRARG